MKRHPLRPAALLGAVLVATAIAAASFAGSAAAEPNRETVLPADGVTSIERTGDTWIVTTVAAPSELKVMSPYNAPVCGVNYPALGSCAG